MGGEAKARVTVLARNHVAAASIAHDCSFVAEEFETSTIARLQADFVVCCASAQSPYENLAQPSAWTRLIEEAGFGVTLPLQTTVVARVARALAEVSPHTLLINGCFPDAVNPLLASLGLPVWCGIGNVATIAACLQEALDLPDQRALAVLGHHAHLSSLDEVLVWRNGSPLSDVSELLRAARALPRRELNAIAGQAAARLLADLANGSDVATSLPGPLGLPGGYPVRIANGAIALNLPAGLSRTQAVEWNTEAGRRDGIEVRDGQVSYTPKAIAALEPHLPEIANGWPAYALEEVTDQFCALRKRLRLTESHKEQ